MTDTLYAEDPEPAERIPAGPLFVPVRSGPAGCSARIFRTPLGCRTAVGFTTRDKLAAALGADHASIRLAEPALRALAAPLGVTVLTIDPSFSAAAPTADSARPTAQTPARTAAPARSTAPTPARSTAPTPAPASRPKAPTPARSAVPTRTAGGSERNRDHRRVGLPRVAVAGAVVSCVNLLIG